MDRWAIIDGDRMRMLRPRGAKRACGFRLTFTLPPTSCTRFAGLHEIGALFSSLE
ncbi:MAG: unnamed protein product [uncultured Paraburkholderia sp.]|nr:MAG: unnamed protein product [uncultured Paraburkholderia sp.]CAH2939636.1 MAG: unnamed protein product [uncultured Paraburkholderia sp.]